MNVANRGRTSCRALCFGIWFLLLSGCTTLSVHQDYEMYVADHTVLQENASGVRWTYDGSSSFNKQKVTLTSREPHSIQVCLHGTVFIGDATKLTAEIVDTEESVAVKVKGPRRGQVAEDVAPDIDGNRDLYHGSDICLAVPVSVLAAHSCSEDEHLVFKLIGQKRELAIRLHRTLPRGFFRKAEALGASLPAYCSSEYSV